MIPSTVEIQINKEEIQKYLQCQIEKAIQSELWFVDAERLVTLTNMSKRFLEDEIFSDVRMRAIERKKNRKRWWPAKQALEVFEEITSEW